MNVAFDPWIPAVTLKGEPQLISLHDAFTKGTQFADLAVRPHERVSLMRLFLCIAHAALNGPKDLDEWYAVPDALGSAASAYFEKWKDSFELFHPTKPWLQVADLQPAGEGVDKYTAVNKLDFSLGLSLVNHFQEDYLKTFTNEQLALGLLTLQNFSTCGLLSMPMWNGMQTAKSAKDAPCIASSMYHVFLVKEELYATICTNICDYNELSILFGNDKKWLGKPIWECTPVKNSDDSIPKTFLGRLVPLSRAILFKQNSSLMLYGEALRYPSFPEFQREFNTSVITRMKKKKEERLLVGARIGIRPWRQLDAILQYHNQEKTCAHAINLEHRSEEAIDIWVGSLLRNPGKQDILDTVESRFHISNRLRSTNGCSVYASEVEIAVNISRKLSIAVYFYRLILDPAENTGIGSLALNHYWTSIEKNLSLLMTHIDTIGTESFIPTQKKWRKMLFSTACDAYRTACGQETPRQIKAFAKGWKKLTEKTDEAESENDNRKEDEE